MEMKLTLRSKEYHLPIFLLEIKTYILMRIYGKKKTTWVIWEASRRSMPPADTQ